MKFKHTDGEVIVEEEAFVTDPTRKVFISEVRTSFDTSSQQELQ